MQLLLCFKKVAFEYFSHSTFAELYHRTQTYFVKKETRIKPNSFQNTWSNKFILSVENEMKNVSESCLVVITIHIYDQLERKKCLHINRE